MSKVAVCESTAASSACTASFRHCHNGSPEEWDDNTSSSFRSSYSTMDTAAAVCHLSQCTSLHKLSLKSKPWSLVRQPDCHLKPVQHACWHHPPSPCLLQSPAWSVDVSTRPQSLLTFTLTHWRRLEPSIMVNSHHRRITHCRRWDHDRMVRRFISWPLEPSASTPRSYCILL